MLPFAYDVVNRILDMFSHCDDDVPSQSDRCECPMSNPQARRLLRLKAGRTTPNGLNDRIAIPKKRTTFPYGPVEMNTWQ